MNAPLKIAIFVGSFPVVSETFILRQITGLLDLGHDVRIFADTRADPIQPEVARYRLLDRTTYMDLPPEMVPWELPTRPIFGRTWVPGAEKPISNLARVACAIPCFIRSFLVYPTLALRALNSADYGFQAASLSVLHRLDKVRRSVPAEPRFDVLHAHFGPVANSFRFAKELFRAPLIVSFHGYDFSAVPRKHGPGVYKSLFAAADAVTANSNYTRKQLENLGCPPEKIHFLAEGLNSADFTYRPRQWRPGTPLRIATVGRLVEKKGHEFAIRAVHKLRQEHPTAVLHIVGDGPLRPALENLVTSLGLQTAIVFHGARDQPDLRRILNDAHLFVLPSVTLDGDQEGQGLALQEAQACGLPVVASDHGPLPEGLLDGKSGFIVPERNADALAERLSYLAKHPQIWPQIGTEGRDFVQRNYDIGQLNLELVEIYRSAMQNHAT
jgi:colanic acid/amylovoran biosynthesis glycosyltransferase